MGDLEGRYIVTAGADVDDGQCNAVVFCGSYSQCRDFVREAVGANGGERKRDGSAVLGDYNVRLVITRNRFKVN